MSREFNIADLVRENVKRLSPYRSARDEFEGEASVYLDANENPFDHDGLNRYPDPYQSKLKEKLSKIKGVPVSNIILGNGSDEIIDLLIRAFCEPKKETILIFPPTYGMYKITADVNAVETVQIPLNDSFQINSETALKTGSKITFICSPNNPTGNEMDRNEIERILKYSKGLVVIDEAYADFASGDSWSERLSEFPNLVVMQTLSKAYGLASIRLGMAFAHAEIISVLNKIKPPYNINGLTQEVALEQLSYRDEFSEEVGLILSEREIMIRELTGLDQVIKVFPSEANFLLVKFQQAELLYQFLIERSIVVRNRASQVADALRLTIGTPGENAKLIQNIKEFYS